ncbi:MULTISPECIES: type I restriction endonuclease, partial [unclassified Herbaspirillum]|uniref:type I restriction endonuclease n=1 Tax=unclassified Herbaspirillum TaxID=2624150 RepID=UPI002106473F
MSTLPQTREQYSAHIPALHLLINLGWHFLSTAQALALRGSTREVILKTRLIEVLQTRRFDYKGEWFPLSPSGIDQILRQVQAVNLTEGLLPANERVYQMLTLGVTVTEFMPDGKKHQPTIALVDWSDATANRWDVTEELEVLSTHGTHHRVPDVVAYVNGLPLVVIEAKRPDATHVGQAMVDEAISQQLRNQRPDEIPQLFAYAQLLLAVSPTEGRYGTTSTPMKFWARWREEQFSDAQLREWKNQPLSADAEAALLAGRPAKLQSYFRQLWAQPLLSTEQDRLLIALLHLGCPQSDQSRRSRWRLEMNIHVERKMVALDYPLYRKSLFLTPTCIYSNDSASIARLCAIPPHPTP